MSLRVKTGRAVSGSGARSTALRRYGYAFVETSLPTAVIVYYGPIVGPGQALLMPSPFRVLSLHRPVHAAARLLLVRLHGARGLPRVRGPRALLGFGRHQRRRAGAHLAAPAPGPGVHPARGGRGLGVVASRVRSSFSRAIESLEESARILGGFGQHVSPEVARRLVAAEAASKSEVRDVCILFLDIRGFTAFAGKRSAGIHSTKRARPPSPASTAIHSTLPSGSRC